MALLHRVQVLLQHIQIERDTLPPGVNPLKTLHHVQQIVNILADVLVADLDAVLALLQEFPGVLELVGHPVGHEGAIQLVVLRVCLLAEGYLEKVVPYLLVLVLLVYVVDLDPRTHLLIALVLHRVGPVLVVDDCVGNRVPA